MSVNDVAHNLGCIVGPLKRLKTRQESAHLLYQSEVSTYSYPVASVYLIVGEILTDSS
jgi:hypothetical protein